MVEILHFILEKVKRRNTKSLMKPRVGFVLPVDSRGVADPTSPPE